MAAGAEGVQASVIRLRSRSRTAVGAVHPAQVQVRCRGLRGKEDSVMTVGLRISMASLLIVGCLAATPVLAHHSAAVAYDQSKTAEAQGIVTRVLVKNPHSWVFLESTDEKGQKIEWQIEMGGASSMAWAKD